MADLDKVADQGTPLLRDLGEAAPQMGRLIKGLGTVSEAADESLPEPRRRAGARPPGADPGAAADPRARRARHARRSPVARTWTSSPRASKDTDGVERINDFLYYLTLSTNGFDSVGHYLRAGLVTTHLLDRTHSTRERPACNAIFYDPQAAASAAAAGAHGSAPRRAETRRQRRAPRAPARGAARHRRDAADGASARKGCAACASGAAAGSTGPRTREPVLDYLLGGER